jgi:hypothetical protein
VYAEIRDDARYRGYAQVSNEEEDGTAAKDVESKWVKLETWEK